MRKRPLWFVGDVHLGRTTASLPRALADHDLDVMDLSPIAAWKTLVEAVLASDAEAVVFAGDVVDSDNARFEAYGPLSSAVQRLTKAGVRVLAVAGNHDVEALPRLARELDGFELIGADGVWEERQLDAVTLVGWSFPRARVRANPLDEFDPSVLDSDRASKPRLGLLHCDLDATVSDHAPVSRASLLAQPVDAWLLGHVHAPSFLASTSRSVPLGYLGSLSPLHRGEVGPRGAIRLDHDGSRLAWSHVELAPVRFESLAVDLDSVRDSDLAGGDARAPDIASLITRAMRERLAAITASREAPELRALVLRVSVHGSCEDFSAVHAALDALDVEGASIVHENRVACICELTHTVRAAYDLDALACGTDAIAMLAREVRALESGVTDAAVELAEYSDRLRLDSRFRLLPQAAATGSDSPTTVAGESQRRRLLRVGHELLSHMLRERRGAT
ncbi:MAG: metallophosphoesterase [Planctomycetes bacterium]|nr:metallophosphoesterase [Planctomycetota bacterium]